MVLNGKSLACDFGVINDQLMNEPFVYIFFKKKYILVVHGLCNFYKPRVYQYKRFVNSFVYLIYISRHVPFCDTC